MCSTIDDKRGHEFEGGGGGVWREDKQGRKVVIKIKYKHTHTHTKNRNTVISMIHTQKELDKTCQ